MTQNKVLDVLKDQLKNSVVDASEILDVILSVISNELIDNGIVYIEDFGVFRPHKRDEYILLNTKTGERLLMPPAIEIVFESYQSDVNFSETSFDSIESIVENDGSGFDVSKVKTDDSSKSLIITFEPDISLLNSVNSAFVNFEPTLLNEGVDLPGLNVISDVPENTNEIEEMVETDVADKVKVDSISQNAKTPKLEVLGVSKAEVTIESVREDELKNTDNHNLIGASIPSIPKHDVLYPHKSSQGYKRNFSKILVPVFGGIAVAITALFFFNATSNKRGKS